MKKILLVCLAGISVVVAAEKPHVLFVTFDDLSRESIGVHGCEVPDITPNMDRIGRNGIRFEHFHVQSGNCTPSRNIMMSGMYQQHNRIFSLGKEGAGNHLLLNTMPSLFQRAGYHTGIIGKNSHHCAFEPFSGWDHEYDGYASTKNPEKVYAGTVAAIKAAKELDEALFLNVNIYDPHTGWYGWSTRDGSVKETSNHPSRIYGPDEVPYPSWFPSLSRSAQVGSTKGKTEGVDMMLEVAAYYNTVKRADDSLGKVLQAFDEAGWTDDLIIVLISDHGAQLPGAKTTLYHEGSVSPLFIQWPGITKPNTVNDTHMVATIDLVPTFCEMIGAPVPAELDGRSIVPILKGKEPAEWRRYVYKQQNDRNKSRAIQTKEWLYVNNHWADGESPFGSVTVGMHSWKLFLDALDHPETAPETKDWINRIQYRMPEELYHVATDPGCLKNLADSKAHQKQLIGMRKLMEQEAVASGDTMVLEAIRNPQDAAVQKATVDRLDAIRAEQSNDPDYSRRVTYDPHDGWQVIDNTMFEPFGEWGIWEAEGEGVALNSNNGYQYTGKSCVEFNGAKADTGRIVTRPIKASALGQLKLEFIIPAKPRAKKGRNGTAAQANSLQDETRFTVQYKAGDGWHDLKTLEGKRIPGIHTMVFDPPQGGWPKTLQLGLQADFADKSDYIALDSVRFTGWQDWVDYPDGGLGNAVLSGTESTKAWSKSIDASDLGIIELDYRFRSDNFGKGDRLLVEYQTSNGWKTVQEHDFSYVLIPGTDYSGHVVFKSGEHDLGKDFRVRFRSAGQSADTAVSVDNVRLRSRRAVLAD